MITFDQSMALVCDVAQPLGDERLPINEAHGRVLSKAVFALVDSPPSDVSAMDGYAVQGEDLLSLPARLRLAGESFAGSKSGGSIESGACVRIFTGAPLPDGADRVVIQEVIRREGDVVIVDEYPGPTKHVRKRGSDFVSGTVLAEAGTRLGYRALVAVAGGDVADVAVWRRPRVVILGTGDELVAPGSASGTPGAIPESVSLGISALAEDWGASVVGRIRLRDDLNAMEKAAGQALQEADLVVVTGGASVGEKDFAKAMFARHDLEIIFSKVAIKPGKPVWLGRAGGRIVMGLPGNPTSALVTARLLLAPLIAGLSGMDPHSAHRWRNALLLAALPACGDRETFVRARAMQEAVEPVSNQDSGAQRALVDADLLIRRPAGAAAAAAGHALAVLDF